jgi:hypothetical protein
MIIILIALGSILAVAIACLILWGIGKWVERNLQKEKQVKSQPISIPICFTDSDTVYDREARIQRLCGELKADEAYIKQQGREYNGADAERFINELERRG